MQLFFHDVGLKGAEKDFPKTIFGKVSIEKIIEHVQPALKEEVGKHLRKEFPKGYCNAWGVPAGAKSIIKNLNIGDAMLLIRTTSGLGDLPALCLVKGFWREQMPEVSNFLWDSNHYPFVFFFDTQEIELTWEQFKTHVDYKMNFRPSGNVYRVRNADDKLSNFGGVQGYIEFLVNGLKVSESETQYQVDTNKYTDDYEEGQRRIHELAYFKRNPQLVKDAKKLYGYTCQVCGFNFKDAYGDLGKEYIECHHINPLSEREEYMDSSINDVCVVCSNCHRMIHRSKPALTIEQLREKLKKL